MAMQTMTLSDRDRRFLQSFLPDEEGAPWMTITDWHRLAITNALLPLTWFAQVHHPDWYVASDLAVYYQLPDGGRSYVGPDIFVVRAHNHLRTSFDSVTEGGFPPFVLEVVSADSLTRDTDPIEGKPHLYDLLGVHEYAIFDPERRIAPQLQGYRRTAEGGWGRWPVGPCGELQSAVLGLTLVADGVLLRLEDEHGNRLPTPDEVRARAEQEQARADAAEARARELEARLARLERGTSEA
jgi:Uma2 family endonuclease